MDNHKVKNIQDKSKPINNSANQVDKLKAKNLQDKSKPIINSANQVDNHKVKTKPYKKQINQ